MWKRPVVLAFAVLGMIGTCRAQEAPAADQPDPEYIKALEAAQQKAADLKEQLEKMRKEAGVKAGELDGLLDDPFGAGEMEKRIAEMKEAARSVVVTTQDRAGFDLYCKGAFTSAAKAFETSRKTKPGRPFPDYFLGLIAFQNADYPAAVAAFDRVIAADKTVTSAHLYKRLAELCAQEKALDDLTLLELFYQACTETEIKLGHERPEFSLANVFSPWLLSDPVLFKCRELLVDVTRLRALDLARKYQEAKTPADKLLLGLLLAEGKSKEPFVTKLAKDHPDDRDVQVFAFLYKYFGPEGGERRETSKTFDEELAAVRKLDPDNGALMLLAIRVIPPERIERPDERTIYKFTPLNDEERKLLATAVRAGRFETFNYYRWKDRETELTRCFGGFLYWQDPSWPGPNLYGRLLEITRRTSYHVGTLLEDGKVDEAVQLDQDVEALWANVVRERDWILTRSIADSVRTRPRKKIMDYVTGDRLARYTDQQKEEENRQADIKVHIPYAMTLAMSPIPRLVELEQKLDNSPAMRRTFRERMKEPVE